MCVLCMCGHTLEVTDVVQCGVERGELFVEDVLVHAKGLGVWATGVEVLLAEDHADLRLEWAERVELSVKTQSHLAGSL